MVITNGYVLLELSSNQVEKIKNSKLVNNRVKKVFEVEIEELLQKIPNSSIWVGRSDVDTDGCKYKKHSYDALLESSSGRVDSDSNLYTIEQVESKRYITYDNLEVVCFNNNGVDVYVDSEKWDFIKGCGVDGLRLGGAFQPVVLYHEEAFVGLVMGMRIEPNSIKKEL